MSRIAFLGLGAMGSLMSANLLQAGHHLTVWNRSSEGRRALAGKGAAEAESPTEAVKNAEIVISMVTDDDASRAVWLDAEAGAIHGLAADTLAIECSTVSPSWIHELHEALGRRTVSLMDAPVVGSRPQAEARQLVFLAGTETEADFDRARPVLEAMGSMVHRTGPLGSGALVKLAVNTLFATQVAAVGELLALFGAAQLETKHLWNIIGTLAVTSPAALGAGRLILNGDFAPLFPIALVTKDLRYAEQCGTAYAMQLPVTAAVRAQFDRALAAGLGDQNIGAVSKLSGPG